MNQCSNELYQKDSLTLKIMAAQVSETDLYRTWLTIECIWPNLWNGWMNELSLNMQNNLHEMRVYWYMFFKVKIDYTELTVSFVPDKTCILIISSKTTPPKYKHLLTRTTELFCVTSLNSQILLTPPYWHCLWIGFYYLKVAK